MNTVINKMKFMGCGSASLALCLLLSSPTPLLAFTRADGGINTSTQISMSVSQFKTRRSSKGANITPLDGTAIGANLYQTLSWGHWIHFQTYGSYAYSGIGGASSGFDANDFTSAIRSNQFGLGVNLFTSIPLDSCKRAFIEPLIGFAALSMRTDATNWGYYDTENLFVPYIYQLYYGPLAGLYLRAFPLDNLSLRAGGAYVMPRYRDKLHDVFYGAGFPQSHFTSRRQGLQALFELEYTIAHWVSFKAAFDYEMLSTSGKDHFFMPALVGQGVDQTAIYKSSRLSWGFDFTY